MQKQYNTNPNRIEGQVFCYRPYPPEWRKKKKVSWLTVTLAAILAALIVFSAVVIARAEGDEVQRWVLCKPKTRVNLRLEPRKDSKSVGWLECGDEFLTDGTKRGNWLRVLDAGECQCWIYAGYVVTEAPEEVNENYVCVARNQVACRRWVDGPKIDGKRGWLKNGRDVKVFCIAGEWAITERGYIRAEWLEVDPA